MTSKRMSFGIVKKGLGSDFLFNSVAEVIWTSPQVQGTSLTSLPLTAIIPGTEDFI